MKKMIFLFVFLTSVASFAANLEWVCGKVVKTGQTDVLHVLTPGPELFTSFGMTN